MIHGFGSVLAYQQGEGFEGIFGGVPSSHCVSLEK